MSDLDKYEKQVLAALCEHDRKLLDNEDMFFIYESYERDIDPEKCASKISIGISNWLSNT